MTVVEKERRKKKGKGGFPSFLLDAVLEPTTGAARMDATLVAAVEGIGQDKPLQRGH